MARATRPFAGPRARPVIEPSVSAAAGRDVRAGLGPHRTAYGGGEGLIPVAEGPCGSPLAGLPDGANGYWSRPGRASRAHAERSWSSPSGRLGLYACDRRAAMTSAPPIPPLGLMGAAAPILVPRGAPRLRPLPDPARKLRSRQRGAPGGSPGDGADGADANRRFQTTGAKSGIIHCHARHGGRRHCATGIGLRGSADRNPGKAAPGSAPTDRDGSTGSPTFAGWRTARAIAVDGASRVARPGRSKSRIRVPGRRERGTPHRRGGPHPRPQGHRLGRPLGLPYRARGILVARGHARHAARLRLGRCPHRDREQGRWRTTRAA